MVRSLKKELLQLLWRQTCGTTYYWEVEVNQCGNRSSSLKLIKHLSKGIGKIKQQEYGRGTVKQMSPPYRFYTSNSRFKVFISINNILLVCGIKELVNDIRIK